jgi:GT2 family glycosyltransferase
MLNNFDVVICTIKRHFVLTKCVESILKNNILPNRLIIVDQNHDNLSILSIKKIFSIYNFKNYLILKNISKKSLTASKNIALKYIKSKYVFFLDDDISVDKYFFFNSLAIMLKKNCTGVCGTILNYQNNPLKNFFYNIFNYFEFKDNRVYFNNDKNKKFKSDSKKIYHLPGGITCFKSSIFKKISFDQNLIIHNYEDVDFNYRLKNKTKNYEVYISFNSYAFDLVKKNIKENQSKRFFYMRLLYLKHKNIKFFIIYYLSFFGLFLSSLIKLDLIFIKNIFKILDLAKKKFEAYF